MEASNTAAELGYKIDSRGRLSYKIVGHGPNKVFFTMGLGGSMEQWEPQVEAMGAADSDFTTCSYDNRGVGLSGAPGGRWTTRDMALDALALLDELDWKEGVHLVGLSMGGMITQELALLDLPRFSSIALLSTIAGGLSSLGLFILSIPTGILTLANTFLSSDPQLRLKNGLKILYPEEFLNESSLNPETRQLELNFNRFRRALIVRGQKRLAAGMPALPIATVFKQAVAVATHNVDTSRLSMMGDHFGDAILVVTGDSDILVHQRNSVMLAKGLNADIESRRLLVLPGAGHGANEQCEAEVSAAICSNIERGNRHRQQQQGGMQSMESRL